MTLARVLLLGLTMAVMPHATAAAQAPATAQDSVLPAPVGAAESLPEAAAHGETLAQTAAAEEPAYDIITPHITDSHHMEVPYWKPPFYREVHLPEWEPVHVGPFTFDFSPTKHVVFLILAALIATLLLVGTARAHLRHSHAIGRPRGFAAGMEAVVLYLRNEVILPNVGPRGNAYVPFLLTLFFFILIANLLGLIPYGSTATGNISVTAMLALITFVVIEVAGMRALGPGYLGTIVYWPHDMPLAMKLPMTFIMTPVEIIGKFTKPFALAIRLFANMTAGHIVVLALIGLIFTFRSFVSGAPFLMAVAIMMLEIFVAFLQAFIFTLLASVFIGQIRESHH